MDSKEIEQIQAETKILLDKFSKALASVKLKEGEESNVERDENRREEGKGEGNKKNETFRKLMFENAPTKDEDFIIAEKKTW